MPAAKYDALDEAYSDLTTIAGKPKVVGKDRNAIYKFTDRYNAAKAMGVPQSTVDALTKEINDAVTNYEKTGHLVSGDSNSGSSSTSTSAKPKAKSRKVKLRKASYQYTHKGKRVSKKKLKKGSIVKINGKTYRIKGKKYYRIAKNRYIRAVNVVKK